MKISFSYPGNFYIKEEGFGSDYDIVVTPNDPRRNPETYVYTSLKMKMISKEEELEKLMNDYQEKSKNKHFYY